MVSISSGVNRQCNPEYPAGDVIQADTANSTHQAGWLRHAREETTRPRLTMATADSLSSAVMNEPHHEHLRDWSQRPLLQAARATGYAQPRIQLDHAVGSTRPFRARSMIRVATISRPLSPANTRSAMQASSKALDIAVIVSGPKAALSSDTDESACQTSGVGHSYAISNGPLRPI